MHLISTTTGIYESFTPLGVCEDCLGFRFSVIAWLLFSLLLLDS
ncbi:hypothetical protein HanPSC8_Chr14g0620211 [Helianthus annuus]|nr:hypothetical protein HanPSC8_Chr14g0620211 [Helianthus annuus]